MGPRDWGAGEPDIPFTLNATDPRLGEPYVLSIGEDNSAAEVARRLHEDGMIRSERSFTARVRLAGGALKTGDHEVRRGMSVAEIVDAITAGDG